MINDKRIIYREDKCFKNYFIMDLKKYDIVCYNHVDNYKIKDGFICNIATNAVYNFNQDDIYVDIDFNNINIDMISDVYCDFCKVSVIRCDTIYNFDDKIIFKNRSKRNYKTYIRLYPKSFIPDKFSIFYKAYIFSDALLKEFK